VKPSFKLRINGSVEGSSEETVVRDENVVFQGFDPVVAFDTIPNNVAFLIITQ
jgi:hypothetical protein